MDPNAAATLNPEPQTAFELFRGLEIFRSFNADELRSIDGTVSTFVISPQDQLEKILHLKDELFFIKSGAINLIREEDPSVDTAVDFLQPGDCFGGDALELLLDMNFVLRADGATVLYGFSASLINTVNDRHPGFRRNASLHLSESIIGAQAHFVNSLSAKLNRARHDIKKLDQLTEASKTLNSSFDLDTLLSLILHAAQEISDAKRGTLYLVDDSKKEIYSKLIVANNITEIRMPFGVGLAGSVAQTGEILNIKNAYDDERFNSKVDERSGFRTETVLCVPMKNKNEKIIGVLQLLNKREGYFTTDDVQWIDALSDHAVIAIENARLYEQERQKQAMEKEMLSARSVQQFLLPQSIPRVAGYEIAGESIPARAIGGDYYDVISISEQRIAICLADVSGKGLPAALLMSNVQAILRSQILMISEPKSITMRTNKLLHQSIDTDKFATMFYSELNTDTGTFTYSNAGHEPAIVLHKDGTMHHLSEGGLVLGIFPEASFEEASIVLKIGDVVVIYSDGITEAINKKKERFGNERLEKILRDVTQGSAQNIMDAIVNDVRNFVGTVPQYDDITIVVVKKLSSDA